MKTIHVLLSKRLNFWVVSNASNILYNKCIPTHSTTTKPFPLGKAIRYIDYKNHLAQLKTEVSAMLFTESPAATTFSGLGLPLLFVGLEII